MWPTFFLIFIVQILCCRLRYTSRNWTIKSMCVTQKIVSLFHPCRSAPLGKSTRHEWIRLWHGHFLFMCGLSKRVCLANTFHMNDMLYPSYLFYSCLTTYWGPFQYRIERLIVRSRKFSMPRDLCLADRRPGSTAVEAPVKFQNYMIILITDLITSEISRDLSIRRIIEYWKGALLLSRDDCLLIWGIVCGEGFTYISPHRIELAYVRIVSRGDAFFNNL